MKNESNVIKNSQVILIVYQCVEKWSHYFKAGNQNGRSESTLQSQEFRLRDNSNGRNDREVNKAKISLSIAIGFIICHSVKWITNILEIKMVIYY